VSFGDDAYAIAAFAVGPAADQGNAVPMQIEQRAVVGQHPAARDWRISDHENLSFHSIRSRQVTGRCMAPSALTLLSIVNRSEISRERQESQLGADFLCGLWSAPSGFATMLLLTIPPTAE
jgi:hypothetical protein